jgi:hypothetical protein
MTQREKKKSDRIPGDCAAAQVRSTAKRQTQMFFIMARSGTVKDDNYLIDSHDQTRGRIEKIIPDLEADRGPTKSETQMRSSRTTTRTLTVMTEEHKSKKGLLDHTYTDNDDR